MGKINKLAAIPAGSSRRAGRHNGTTLLVVNDACREITTSYVAIISRSSVDVQFLHVMQNGRINGLEMIEGD